LYQAIHGFEDHLKAELSPFVLANELASASDLASADEFDKTSGTEDCIEPIAGSLYHVSGSAPVDAASAAIYWYQNCWLEPFQLEFSSINEAASVLRGIQRNWSACLHTHYRRGALISAKLPPISAKPRPFPWLVGDSPVGAWTLLDAHTMIASAHCSSPFPGGVIEFAQDKEGPPSRAYLKLWEALVRLRRWPSAGDFCIDAGASPGGWTWALAQLGARVCAIDRAPLEDRIAALPGVEYVRHDAFTLKPRDIGPVDWLFCDAACYPPRLYEWIAAWLESGLCRNFVCTIKMQGIVNAGAVDFTTPRRFAEIPGSAVVHLYHNKHELTWMMLE
jgi:23S rRNA (cytidine2498-2'-O)-methyltransferase